MQRGQRSVTAEFSAVLRAIHMLLDPKPSVFVDCVVKPLMQLNRQMLERTLQELEATAAKYGDPRYAAQVAASLRMFTVLRSRLARDTFLRSNLEQIVLLGAGLDLSIASETDVPVFAVDQPEMSRWSRSLIADTGVQIGDYLLFVEFDFAVGSVSLNHSP